MRHWQALGVVAPAALAALFLLAGCSHGSPQPTVTIRVRGTSGVHVSGAYITRAANGAVAFHTLSGTLPLQRTLKADEAAFYVSSDQEASPPLRDPLSAGLDRRPQRGAGDSIAVISSDPLPPAASSDAGGTPAAGGATSPLAAGPLTVAVSTSCDPVFLRRLPLPRPQPNAFPPPPSLPSPCERPSVPDTAPGAAQAAGGSVA